MHHISKLLLLLLSMSTQCQTDYGTLERLYSLPEELHENSGMEVVSGLKNIYVVNDSGNSNTVFAINPANGNIAQEITVTNAKNKDWEDLTSRDTDLFIGDFGNNGNLRRDLIIYWIENVNDLKGAKVSAFAKAISFTLEDQTKFPPKKKDRNFDIEAFFAKGDYFYLFTKNRSSAFDGTTKCYKLPIAEGTQIATLISSFNTGSDPKDCFITSATINKNSGDIALLSYNKVWLIQDYVGDDFFKGTINKIKLKHSSQKESIFFQNKNTLLIGDESSKDASGNLYRLRLN